MPKSPTLAVHCTVMGLSCSLTALSSANILAFDESRDGDASDDRFAPSIIALTEGMNTLRGFSGQSSTPDVHDLDYITFTISEGLQLDGFFVQAASVGGAFSFVGLQAGPQITIPADWTDINTPLLGWAHFGSSTIGADILPDMAISPGSIGFSGPLASGTYALWIMELDASEPHTYSFGLRVSSVPGPSALALSIAFGVIGTRRARSSRIASITKS
jgi:hypothetical protein